MEPAEIIASVNRENTELQNQNHQLRINFQETNFQLSEARALNVTFQNIFQARDFEMYMAAETINSLSQQIQFQQAYIAHVENQSEQAKLACKETTAFFHQLITAQDWSRIQWSQSAARLSPGAKDLHQTVLEKINASVASDEQATKLMNRITEMESNALLRELQYNELKRALQSDKKRLKEMRERTSALTTTQQDLNRRLVATNKRLHSKAGKSKHALEMAQKEKKGLEEELKNANKALQELEEREQQLNKAIHEAERLQSEHRAALAETETFRLKAEYYQSQDKNQMQTITGLKKKVADLQDAGRDKGYLETIKGLKAENAQLVCKKNELENKIQEKARIVTESLTKMVEHIEIAKEARREVATYKGHALAQTTSLLDGLSKTNLELGSNIVTAVFCMLKDLDNKKKAKQATDEMRGYLMRQRQAVIDYVSVVASNATKVTDLMEDILGRIPKEVEPKSMKNLIEYIHGLRNELDERTSQLPT